MEIAGYQILEPIGEGGMAKAYLAVQSSLGRKVVLKVLDTSIKDSKENVERFLNEGRIVASLNHPNIVHIYDIGIADEYIFLSMEYIEGGDLRSRMAANILTPAEAIDIICKIASGLDAAHKNGIVHRDVKPGNILFRKDGTPLLSDFGIAKKLTVDQELTSTGVFLGSPNYMAPEQAEAGPIDGRADIYSLGIILYEMLTGSKPYQSDSVIDVIVQHKQAPIPRLPPRLEAYQPLLNLMLAKDRKDRFRDCDSMIHYIQNMDRSGHVPRLRETRRPHEVDLTALPKVIEVPTPTPTFGKIQHRSKRTNRTHLVLGLLLLVSGGVFLGLQLAAWLIEREANAARIPVARIANPATVIGTVATAPTPSPPPEGANAEVIKALSWLANNSLLELRLTDPPKDNAYYYYSRLLEIDPNNVEARQGLLRVAEGFAVLAERELANNNYELAQSYVKIGLQVDPQNQALQTLQTLAQPQHTGFFKSLLRLFESS